MEEALREAIAWYEMSKARWIDDLSHRSDEIAPNETFWEAFDRARTNGVGDLESRWSADVESSIKRRGHAIRSERSIRSLPELIHANPGHLLSVGVQSVMWDGLAIQFTSGFLGVDDCPPWDFWVGLFPHCREVFEEFRSYEELQWHLVSWIPCEIIDRVEAFEYVRDSSIEWIRSDATELIGVEDTLKKFPMLCYPDDHPR